jgi:tRNA A37 threonylcarbamoyladenosine biosynthesis protein TsaE
LFDVAGVISAISVRVVSAGNRDYNGPMGLNLASAGKIPIEIEILDLGGLDEFAAATSEQTLAGHMIGLSGPLGVGKSDFDLYRLEGPDDVRELGFDDALDAGPVLVEWPDRLGHLIPENRLDISFAFGEQASTRNVTLVGHGDWVKRLNALVATFNR